MNLSEKLSRILRSKTDLTDEQLEQMTEREGWAVVYSLRSQETKEKKVEVCFTGFSPADKKELIQIANDNNIHIAKSITKGLMFLCCGGNAGPSKMVKAEKQGVKLIDKETFFNILETGELPITNI
jgi:NAD-dependent DNA ligase